MTKGARFYMRVDDALLDQVREIAAKRGVTVTHMVNQFFLEAVRLETAPKSDEELGVEQA